MKDKIFGVLQRVGRSFMLPIAILPVAGLLLGIGSSFTNATTIETYGLQAILGDGTILNALLTIMSRAGNIIFDNLPIIFAVGVAIGMAKEGKRSCGSGGDDLILRHECNDQRHAHCTGRDPLRRDDSRGCIERNDRERLRDPDIADGCVRRYHRGTRRCGAAQ